MDAKGFFLGLIAAVVLFLLWKKESGDQGASTRMPVLTPSAPAPNFGGCAGCGAAPSVQAALPVASAGQISPGTPPLGSIAAPAGVGSFYTVDGVTPDTTFTFGAPAVGPTPGSPTTPASIAPARSTEVLPDYAGTGSFQQRFNVAGVPRAVLAKNWVM